MSCYSVWYTFMIWEDLQNWLQRKDKGRPRIIKQMILHIWKRLSWNTPPMWSCSILLTFFAFTKTIVWGELQIIFFPFVTQMVFKCNDGLYARDQVIEINQILIKSLERIFYHEIIALSNILSFSLRFIIFVIYDSWQTKTSLRN